MDKIVQIERKIRTHYDMNKFPHETFPASFERLYEYKNIHLAPELFVNKSIPAQDLLDKYWNYCQKGQSVIPINPFLIVTRMNIKIDKRLESDDFAVIHVRKNGLFTISVNKKLPEARQNFVAAHCLGILTNPYNSFREILAKSSWPATLRIFKEQFNIDFTRNNPKYTFSLANSFAANLLIPMCIDELELVKQYSQKSFIKYATMFKVTPAVLKYRIELNEQIS